jgi:RNA-splicing ligase RtcB
VVGQCRIRHLTIEADNDVADVVNGVDGARIVRKVAQLRPIGAITERWDE